MNEAVQTLKTDLGTNFDAKMTIANRAITEIGGDDLIKVLETSGLGRNPTVVKAFIKMGEMMGEEGALDVGGLGGPADTTELDSQIAEIQTDKAYIDSSDPRHKTLVAKMETLMKKRYPDEKLAPGTIRLF